MRDLNSRLMFWRAGRDEGCVEECFILLKEKIARRDSLENNFLMALPYIFLAG